MPASTLFNYYKYISTIRMCTYTDIHTHVYIYIFNLNYPGKLILCSQSRHQAASHRMDKQPESH